MCCKPHIISCQVFESAFMPRYNVSKGYHINDISDKMETTPLMQKVKIKKDGVHSFSVLNSDRRTSLSEDLTVSYLPSAAPGVQGYVPFLTHITPFACIQQELYRGGVEGFHRDRTRTCRDLSVWFPSTSLKNPFRTAPSITSGTLALFLMAPLLGLDAAAVRLMADSRRRWLFLHFYPIYFIIIITIRSGGSGLMLPL